MISLSYKIGIKTAGDHDWNSNGLRFASRDDAQAYGEGLAYRWLAVSQWTVIPSTDAPNR
jgi:hypothetical protein